MTSSSSPSDKALRITIVATVAAVAAYVGYRAYKKQYPFEELMSKGKGSKKEETEVPADKVDEIPIEKVAESDSEDKAMPDQVSATPSELASLARSTGNELYGHGKYDSAAEYYTRSIELYPKDNKDLALAYSNRAACYLHMRRFSAVIDDCDKALEITPEMIKALDRRCQAYEHLNKTLDALVDATAICLIDDFSTTSFVAKVETLLRRSSYELANEEFKTKQLKLPSKWFMDEFFSVFPGEWDSVDMEKNINFKKAIDALRAGKYRQAADLCASAIESAGEDAIMKAKTLSLKASFDILKGDIAAADAALNESMSLNVHDANVLIKLALVHLEKNEFIEMTRALEQSFETNPVNPALFYHRGEVLALSGTLEAAVKDFEEAEKLYPGFEISYVHHARALLGLNQAEEAEQVLIKALDHFKDSVELRNSLGEVYVWKQDFRLAEKTFNDILSSKPKSPQVQLNLALLKMTENNNVKGAEEHLKKALQIDPTFEAAHLQLANLMISVGRNEEAMKHFENAIAHARSLQELTSVYSLKLASEVQLKCMEKFPYLAEKLK